MLIYFDFPLDNQDKALYNINRMKNKTYKIKITETKEIETQIYGGHKGLKIYGRVDCANARRWIAKGHYVSKRVFFANETKAILAGYRPCGCCLKEEYKEWRGENINR